MKIKELSKEELIMIEGGSQGLFFELGRVAHMAWCGFKEMVSGVVQNFANAEMNSARPGKS